MQEDRWLSGFDDDVADQTLMVVEIADDPYAAVQEEYYAGTPLDVVGLHDEQLLSEQYL